MEHEILSITRLQNGYKVEYRIQVKFTWRTGFGLWKSTHTAVETFRGSSTIWNRESDGHYAGTQMNRLLSAAVKVHEWAQEG